MTKPILYYCETNAQSRFVMMVAKEIGLDMDYRPINIIKKEQFKPEFTKINPMHMIPTLDDNGVLLWDCHAICTYLVTKYGKNDKLYPKDLVFVFISIVVLCLQDFVALLNRFCIMDFMKLSNTRETIWRNVMNILKRCSEIILIWLEII